MFLLILFLSGVTYSNAVWVNTRSGPLIGSQVLYEGKVVQRFLGIPYAEPPVGNLRFKKTVPVRLWSVPYMATTYKPSCPQSFPYAYPWVDVMPGQSENCLNLNIWVPKSASKNSPKSVMFWIHGGDYSTGSNRLPCYDGQVLAAEQDVIVVTVNYRLGILGFLSTSSEEAPGNMGLYDILEALKWINYSIEAFGGNSKSITLFGQNIGSTICAYFIVSPLSRGLFQRVIMESGSPSSEMKDVYRENLKLGQKVADFLNCSSDSITLENNPKEVVGCLKSKTGVDLSKAFISTVNASHAGFYPVCGDDFLPMNPLDALQQNSSQPVDVMIGFVRDEGSFMMGALYPKIFGPYGEKNPRISRTLGRKIIKKYFKNHSRRDEIVDYYLEGLREKDYDAVRNQTYHAVGDYTILCPAMRIADLFSSKGFGLYCYYYSHQYANTVFPPWTGVTHSMEVPLVFGRPFDTFGYTDDELILSLIMMDYWTNFAKNGSPSSMWKKFSEPDFYTEQIQLYDNYNNYFFEHVLNCEFLKT